MKDRILKVGQVGCQLGGINFPQRLDEPAVNVAVETDRKVVIKNGSHYLELSIADLKTILPMLNLVDRLFGNDGERNE